MRKHYFMRLLCLLFCSSILISVSLAQGGVVDPDPDKDGLPNSIDACDNEAGPRSNQGCPVENVPIRATDVPPPDSDGDGTADPLDRCPNEAGDGANGGCPIGQTAPSTEPTAQTTVLEPAPTTGECVLSTGTIAAVNLRESPTTESAIIAVLPPNEWFTVLAVFSAPSELYNNAFANAPAPFLAFFPNSMDTSNETWYLVQKVNEPTTGWVAAGAIRLGGECNQFDIAEKKKGGKKDQQAFLVVTLEEVFVSSRPAPDEDADDAYVVIAIIGVLIGSREAPEPDDDTPDDEQSPALAFPAINPIIFVAPSDETEAAVDFFLKFDGVDGESSDRDHRRTFVQTELLEEGCELAQDANGVISPTCEDGSLPSSLPICTQQELNEAGVFDTVCYNVEIPEGCMVDSSEAGLWHVSCEDAGEDGVQVTPIGETEPILDLLWYDDNTIGIGLLLPAVQKVREAANR